MIHLEVRAKENSDHVGIEYWIALLVLYGLFFLLGLRHKSWYIMGLLHPVVHSIAEQMKDDFCHDISALKCYELSSLCVCSIRHLFHIVYLPAASKKLVRKMKKE